jgi:hypothetical protein
MPRPTLSQLAQIAEVIAAVAVVISLVYVGGEVRQNTAAVRGAAMQAVAATDANALLTVASDSALASIFRRGMDDPAVLSGEEAFRFFIWQRQFWLWMQNIYQQSELDLIDPSVWDGYLSIICGQWQSPGVRGTWGDHSDVVNPDFAALVESCDPG